LRPNGCIWIKMPLGMEVGLGPGDFVLDGDPALLTKRWRSLPILGPCLLWPNAWMDQDATWHGGRPQPRPLCVRWGPNPLPENAAQPFPQFSAHFYCGQAAEYIKMPPGMEVCPGPGDFVFDGDPAETVCVSIQLITSKNRLQRLWMKDEFVFGH